jgi:hypothetical protein
MKIKWTLLIAILTLAFAAHADNGDDEECFAYTNAVQVIRIPQDCFTTPESGPNFYHYTFTNAGNYRFLVDTSRVFVIIHHFPFSFPLTDMSQGEAHDFYLPCNYFPYYVTFGDVTMRNIPVQRLPVGVFNLYTAGELRHTNTQWFFVRSVTNTVDNSMLFAPFYRNEAKRFYSVRAGD